MMKLWAVAALVAVTSAHPPDVVFQVTELMACCIPHSVECYYLFYAYHTGAGEARPGYFCGDKATGLPEGSGPGPLQLPNVTRGRCAGSSRVFDVARSDAGLVLTVRLPVSPRSETRGAYTIPWADIRDFEGVTPTGAAQFYAGPANISLTFVV